MALSSTFVKLALLTNDDFGLLLAAESQRNKKFVKKSFNFHSIEAPRYKMDFRFEKQDIIRLNQCLNVPDVIKINSNGSEFNGFECLCVLLRRMTYPNRLSDLSSVFGKSPADISYMFNAMINHVYDNFSYLLTSVDLWWLSPDRIHHLTNALQLKGCPLPNCFGFIDGTLHKTCRPRKYQKEVYSGHKRAHGLKYQSVVTPNGLIANLYGPVVGRRHDSYMLQESQLLQKLTDSLGAQQLNRQYYVYGDGGYPLSPFIITPHAGNNLTDDQQRFNTIMSQLRVCVEWEFGHIDRQFAFVDFKKNQKIFLQPVAKYYYVAALLKNCQACLYGSQTSIYFNLKPPTLEQYLSNMENN